MMRRNLRAAMLPAALLAWVLVPGIVRGQAGGNGPAIQGPATVKMPSWQTNNAFWRQFDYNLMTDFPDLAHYHDADLKLGPPAPGVNRVVFMGDSITAGWHLKVSFPGKPYINRGISAQSSPQMVLRFRQDVIDLQPKVVVILAGTNDIAENTGPMTLGQTENNLMSMADLSTANGIKPVLCSVLPSTGFWWHKGLHPAAQIKILNKWIKAYAARKGYVYVDYYSPLVDAQGGLPQKYSRDGVHPNAAGRAVMVPLTEAGIEKALKSGD
jgi:acyl-CoA thioesterase I